MEYVKVITKNSNCKSFNRLQTDAIEEDKKNIQRKKKQKNCNMPKK